MLEAALKYQIDDAVSALRDAWRLLIPEYPLQIFAAACRLRLHEETQMAAKAWKTQAVWKRESETENFPRRNLFHNTMEGASYIKEMESLSAGTFHRFLSFLRTDPDPDIHFTDFPPSTRPKCPQSSKLPPMTNGTHFPKTDIILRCSDGADVHVHRLILALSEADELLTIQVESHLAADNEDLLPVYQVNTESPNLDALVRLCYPFAEVKKCITGLRQLEEVVQLAHTYNVPTVRSLIRRHFSVFSNSEPLVGYYIATKLGWPSEADHAASLVCQARMYTEYTWAMEQCGAHAHVHLLELGHQSRQIMIMGRKRARRLPSAATGGLLRLTGA
jgi:hypothetical protein